MGSSCSYEDHILKLVSTSRHYTITASLVQLLSWLPLQLWVLEIGNIPRIDSAFQ